jgi:hypothetical protein
MKNRAIYLVISFITSGILMPGYAMAQNAEEKIMRAESLEERMESESSQDTIHDRSVHERPAAIRTERPGRADTTSISVGRRQLRVIEGQDTTTISVGSREVRIVEKDGNTTVNILERDRNDFVSHRRRGSRFRGNWSGLDIGLNNYVTDDFSTSLGQEEDFMELHAARSWNVNLNVLQYDLTLSDNNIGLVTGLGLEMNNYRFSNNVSITKEARTIVPVDYAGTGINLDRTRLRTYYITVPLLLEFQTKNQRKSQRAYFSAGVIGGLNIGSNARVVYRDNSRRYRDKVRDDYYLSPFRYGLTVRTGYRSLNLYANYYPTGLFQQNRGPELYPVAVGFSILNF